LSARVEALRRDVAGIPPELFLTQEALRRKLERLRSEQSGPASPSVTPPPLKIDALAGLPPVGEKMTSASSDISSCPAAPTAGVERRTASRRKGNPVPVTLSNARATSPALDGWIIDRSGTGIGVLVDEAVEVGTVLSVRPTKAHSGFGWLQVEVKNCRPDKSNWKLGCQFLQKL